MKVLMLDSQGLMLDMALRAMEDGHQIRWRIPQGAKTENIGRGLVNIIDDWQGSMKWADLVILADNTRYLKELVPYRKDGPPIIGATEESASWELDREKGQDVFAEAGIDVPDYREFTKYDDAITYVKKEMRRFVSKPCGDEPDKSLTYCAKDPADMVYMLERWKALGKLKSKFLLQEFIPGTEIAVGAWVGPHGFNKNFLINFEEKKLMAGGSGPNCGEMGTTMMYAATDKLAKQVLSPLEDRLVDAGHVGYIDVNCIVDDHGDAWPLEWTARFGWPCYQIQTPLHRGDDIQFLSDLAEGRDARNTVADVVSVGVVVSIPDFPYSIKPRAEVIGIPIYGVTDRIGENVHFCEVMQKTAPVAVSGKVVNMAIPCTAGDYVLVCTGTGDTVRDAARKAYSVVRKIDIPSSPMHRVDIGKRLQKALPDLQKHGYAKGLIY